MIVPMKKATILVQTKDAGCTVQGLRRLGLLHVEHKNSPQGKDITALQEEASLINSCLDVLRQAGVLAGIASSPSKIGGDWRAVAKHIVDLGKHHEQLEAYSRNIISQIHIWERWGDFDHREIQHLSQKGIYLRLYEVPVKEISNFPEDVVVKNIFTESGMAHCVTVSRRQFECPFKETLASKQSLSLLKERLADDKKGMGRIRNDILKAGVFYGDFIETKKNLEKNIEFQRVLSGMGRDGAFTYVTGYIPDDAVVNLQQEARKEKWALLIGEPKEEDEVPTLIRNPRWISVITPVFKLLELIPGYKELDISVLFLIFFSLFFGMIIGDAGYGAIYLLLTFWLQKKLGGKVTEKRLFPLLYVLSSSAILWGMLTGTLFGQEWYIRAGFKPLIPVLNDTRFLQALCFFIGAFHLSLAHSWRAALKFPSLTALADMGWICVLWAAFFLAKTLILDDPLPFFCKWLIISGIALVILCTNPQKNILKMAGDGLAAVALSLMNNFTDVVSYIRLFAVGLAGVAIADTVNTLAAGLGSGNFIGKALIIFIGHTLNVLLGPMSVLVHGIRLNVLEFSGHASITWSGVAYRPLEE